jgi:cytoskeleton-associated protein 5
VAIFGLIDRTMPGSKVMQFYVEYGITSSSAKTRAAAMEQLAQLIRRRGDVVASGATAAKTYKRIAEFISSPDSATRSAALDCIAYMYHHTGDSVLTTIGELKPKERDLLKNRIDKLSSGSLAAPLKSATSSSESPRSPRHSTSQAATTPDRTSDSPSSIGSPVPQRKAGQPMLSSIPAIRQAVPRRLQSMTVDPQKEDRDDIQQSTSQQPRIKQSNHMFDTSEPSMIESSETRVGLAIKAIQSNQPDASVDALKKIQRTLMSSPGDMLRYSNALINAIATRLETIFSNATRITDPPTFRLTKHLIQTLSNFCDHSQLVETVSGDGLKDLIGQLSLGLLMTDNSDGELKDMSRFMNMSILRLFATGPRITIYELVLSLPIHLALC